jgi:hypothetical protein
MKNINLLIRNPIFWVIIGAFLVTFALVIVSISYYNHECPKVEIPELTKETIEQIKKINNAETINDIDSLLLELYGFGSK